LQGVADELYSKGVAEKLSLKAGQKDPGLAKLEAGAVAADTADRGLEFAGSSKDLLRESRRALRKGFGRTASALFEQGSEKKLQEKNLANDPGLQVLEKTSANLKKQEAQKTQQTPTVSSKTTATTTTTQRADVTGEPAAPSLFSSAQQLEEEESPLKKMFGSAIGSMAANDVRKPEAPKELTGEEQKSGYMLVPKGGSAPDPDRYELIGVKGNQKMYAPVGEVYQTETQKPSQGTSADEDAAMLRFDIPDKKEIQRRYQERMRPIADKAVADSRERTIGTPEYEQRAQKERQAFYQAQHDANWRAIRAADAKALKNLRDTEEAMALGEEVRAGKPGAFKKAVERLGVTYRPEAAGSWEAVEKPEKTTPPKAKATAARLLRRMRQGR
jgi:hypothetical protein